jgi:hypothetical protein
MRNSMTRRRRFRKELNGTTEEGGARDRDRVQQNCAMPFPAPAKASATPSYQTGDLNPNGSRNSVVAEIPLLAFERRHPLATTHGESSD